MTTGKLLLSFFVLGAVFGAAVTSLIVRHAA